MRPRPGRPVILAACDDPGDTRRIERELRTRYEADYRVVFEGSAGAGLKALQRLGEAGHEVALVLADQQMRGTGGVAFLTHVGEVHPTAKRLLLTTRTERSGGAILASAVGEGSIAIQQVHEYLSMAQHREEGSGLPARATPGAPS